MSECINSQELYCFLQGYNLSSPTKDNWRSIKNVIKVWVDCWFNGSEPKFIDNDMEIEVIIDDNPMIRLRYDEEMEAYPLYIEMNDGEDWWGDSYPLLLQR